MQMRMLNLGCNIFTYAARSVPFRSAVLLCIVVSYRSTFHRWEAVEGSERTHIIMANYRRHFMGSVLGVFKI